MKSSSVVVSEVEMAQQSIDQEVSSCSSQTELSTQRTLLFQSLQHKETELQRLQQEAKDISCSSQTAVQRSEDSFREMALLLEKRRSEVEQQIQFVEQTQLRQIQDLQNQLQRDIIKLNRYISKLDTLSLTPDNNQVLHLYPTPSTDTQRTETANIQTGPRCYFEDVTTAVSALMDKLKLTLNEDLTGDPLTSRQVHVTTAALPTEVKSACREMPGKSVTNDSLPQSPIQAFLADEPKTRQDFLKYYTEITLDPNTAHTRLTLSDGNRRVTVMKSDQEYPDHPHRFSNWKQVLSTESLTGRCYWELEWSGRWVDVALSYRDIQRKGHLKQCGFGKNDISWALVCDTNHYSFWSNSVMSKVKGPISHRIGVYLDHTAGTLLFYSIQDQTMTLLHRVQTTFTEPLYAGARLYWLYVGDTVHFPKLK